MEKRLTMILACLFLSLGIALAQSSAVIGATVRVAGTNTGTVTDADGKFSITLPSGHDKLQVSYVGMVTQEVTVKGRNVTVTLEADQTNLDEVMVVAYGTAKKSAFTGRSTQARASPALRRPSVSAVSTRSTRATTRLS